MLCCHINSVVTSPHPEGSTFPLESSRATQKPPANLAKDSFNVKMNCLDSFTRCLSLSIFFLFLFLVFIDVKNLTQTWNKLSIQFACSSFARRLGVLPMPSVHTSNINRFSLGIFKLETRNAMISRDFFLKN